jgi:threonine/homoserine/homoserine lactone efflux protein
VGIYFLFFKKVKVAETGGQLVLFSRSDYAKMFVAGAVMNMLNPGIIVFWFVWATAYISHTLQQRAVIFGVALLVALAADIAKVVLADKLRKSSHPKIFTG